MLNEIERLAFVLTQKKHFLFLPQIEELTNFFVVQINDTDKSLLLLGLLFFFDFDVGFISSVMRKKKREEF
jgi:hypothetical protein